MSELKLLTDLLVPVANFSDSILHIVVYLFLLLFTHRKLEEIDSDGDGDSLPVLLHKTTNQDVSGNCVFLCDKQHLTAMYTCSNTASLMCVVWHMYLY